MLTKINRDSGRVSTLLKADSRQEAGLAPGVLPLLKLTVGLRFLLFAVGALLFAAGVFLFGDLAPSRDLTLLGLFSFIESTLLLILVFWPRVRRQFGAWFLPFVLAWFTILPAIQQILFATIAEETIPRPESLESFGRPTIALIWLVIPVVLIAWQYGRRGLWISIGLLVVVHLLLGLLTGFKLEGVPRAPGWTAPFRGDAP